MLEAAWRGGQVSYLFCYWRPGWGRGGGAKMGDWEIEEGFGGEASLRAAGGNEVVGGAQKTAGGSQVRCLFCDSVAGVKGAKSPGRR